MPSPFPGMDPFLEDNKIWPEFQHLFVTCLYQAMLPGLVDRYRARVGQRRYVTEQALFISVVREEHCEEFIEIRQRGADRLVTLVDVVAPANKTTTVGRQHYLDQRAANTASGANLVEIDLVLQGQPTLDHSRDGHPDWDYAVTVTHSARPEPFDVSPGSLMKALPRFKLPLARDDRDLVIELQAVFSRAYDLGDFGAKIDYKLSPTPTLKDADRQWLHTLLKKQKLR
jgi:hypothetical protein